MTEEKIAHYLHLDDHHRLSGTTLVESLSYPGIPEGTIGRVEGDYSLKGTTRMRVRWNASLVTDHEIVESRHHMRYEILDATIRYYGELENESPESRIARAKTTGTSSLDRNEPSLDDPWDTERCRFCEGFHHSYEPRLNKDPEIHADFVCRGCGDTEDHPSHGPPCTE
jgi:hypothetical protein